MLYQFVISIFIIQAILFLTHFFLYKAVVRIFAITNPGILFFLKAVFSVLAVSFVVVSLFIFSYSSILAKIFYIIAATWLGFFYFFLWAAIIFYIIHRAFKLAPLNPPAGGGSRGDYPLLAPLKKGGRGDYSLIFSLATNQKLLAIILFSLAVLVGAYSIVNARNVRVTEIVVALPNLPLAWQGRRAVWISDTHLGPVRNYGFAKRIVKMASELKPDMVFIGGDLYDGTAGNLEKLAVPFGNIAAPLGIYFITGNHEGFGENGKYLEAAQRAGMRVLNNEMVDVDGVQIIGIDYMEARKKENFQSILRSVNLDKRRPSILLKHSSFHIEVGAEEGVSLQLSGHSHAGQIFPMGYITSWIFKDYDYGLKKYGDMIVYTSGGAGTWAIPMRLGAMPEIVVIKFK